MNIPTGKNGRVMIGVHIDRLKPGSFQLMSVVCARQKEVYFRFVSEFQSN